MYIKALWLAIVVLQILDLVTTHIGVQMFGLHETNPFVRHVLYEYGTVGFAALKTAALLLLYLLTRLLTDNTYIYVSTLTLPTIIYTLVIVNNIRELINYCAVMGCL